VKKLIVWLLCFSLIFFLAKTLWAENCNTVQGADAQERMDNIRDCREANALERIADFNEPR
jgi:hypothetical protein